MNADRDDIEPPEAVIDEQRARAARAARSEQPCTDTRCDAQTHPAEDDVRVLDVSGPVWTVESVEGWDAMHGPSCVDCASGVTGFHRSRTDKPNPLRDRPLPTVEWHKSGCAAIAGYARTCDCRSTDGA